ncbi:MAG: DUF4173 domain-containing protein [Bacteroidia bacterium]
MKTKVLFWTAFSALLHLIFYKVGIGVNTLIFTILTALTIWTINGFKKNNWPMYIITIASAIPAIYNATVLGLIMNIVAILTLVGLETENLRFSIWAFTSGFLKMVMFKVRAVKPTNKEKSQVKPLTKKVHPSYIITPILVSILFLLMYMNSIPLLSDFISEFKIAFARLFQDISIFSILFYLFVLILSGFIFFKRYTPTIVQKDEHSIEKIEKKRHKVSQMSHAFEAFRFIPRLSILSLKHEFNIAKRLLASLNVIIAFTLIIGYYGLLNPEINAGRQAYEVVHQNTFSLIFSLLLGALVVIYFFRGNLNFYKKSESIKLLSKTWIVQNGFLALLDFFANHNYVINHGLTYKRLGVFFFLILTFIGLVFVFMKIDYKHSTFNVLKSGVYTVFFFTVLASPINWDGIIVRHNLGQAQEEIHDLNYCLSLSNNALPALIAQKHIYELAPYVGLTYKQVIENKSNRYSEKKRPLLGKSIIDHKIEKSIAQFKGE